MSAALADGEIDRSLVARALFKLRNYRNSGKHYAHAMGEERLRDALAIASTMRNAAFAEASNATI